MNWGREGWCWVGEMPTVLAARVPAYAGMTGGGAGVAGEGAGMMEWAWERREEGGVDGWGMA